MTTTAQPTTIRRRRARLSDPAALVLQASIIVAFLAASSAPTPMYPLLQARWGFSASTVTVVFGIYALAVLSALLTVGSLSDHVGRRPVLLAALAVQAVALLVFVDAHGVVDLVVARILQGLATGAAAGAVGAGMVDLHPGRGTLANAVAPVSGTATGALASGLFIQFLPAPTHLVYWSLLGIVTLQAVGVTVMPETALRRAGALRSLRPRFDLPRDLRGPLLVATPALIASWALAGFYGSLGPSLVALLSGSGSSLLGGLALFVLAGVGALSVLAMRNLPSATIARTGTAALAVGVAITLAGTAAGSELGFFLGTAIAGVGFAGGFQGAIRTVLPLADAEHRAGVLSVIYLISYLALGVPAVAAGVTEAHTHSLQGTTQGYGIILIVLAGVAFAGLNRRGRSVASTAPAQPPASDTPAGYPQPCMG